MVEEEKASNINPPELVDTEIVVQEVIEKTTAVIHECSDGSKVNAKKKNADIMRRKSMKTFRETKPRLNDESPKARRTRRSGSETMVFPAKKQENDAEFRKEELRLKSEE